MKVYVIINDIGNIVGVISSKTKMHRRIEELGGKGFTWSEWIIDHDYTDDELLLSVSDYEQILQMPR